MVTLTGSFDILVDTGRQCAIFRLDCPYRGLYIPPMKWIELMNFSRGATCLVYASDLYDEDDYWRDYASVKRSITTNFEQ